MRLVVVSCLLALGSISAPANAADLVKVELRVAAWKKFVRGVYDHQRDEFESKKASGVKFVEPTLWVPRKVATQEFKRALKYGYRSALTMATHVMGHDHLPLAERVESAQGRLENARAYRRQYREHFGRDIGLLGNSLGPNRHEAAVAQQIAGLQLQSELAAGSK